MTIIVTGLECSGTKWLTSLLSKHPEVENAIHHSIPELPMPKTQWPELSESDKIAWVTRYEAFRLLSLSNTQYDNGRPKEFTSPSVYFRCYEIFERYRDKIYFVSYEALVGPLGQIVLFNFMRDVGLTPVTYPAYIFDAQDANRKYMK